MDIIGRGFQFVVALVLSLVILGTINYYMGIEQVEQMGRVVQVSQYLIEKHEKWQDRFKNLTTNRFNLDQVHWLIKNDSLIIQDQGAELIILYSEHISQQTINKVYRIAPNYYLVNYGDFQEVLYFQAAQGNVCLQLETQGTYIKYYLDHHNHLWIVSIPFNRILLIQLYSCAQQQIKHTFKHLLSTHSSINQIGSIVSYNNGLVQVQLLTYQAHTITLSIDLQHHIITEKSILASHTLQYQTTVIKPSHVSVYGGITTPNGLVQYIYKHTTLILQSIMQSSLQKQSPNLVLDKDLMVKVMDPINHCVLQLFKENSTLISLDNFLIKAKFPIFTSEKYDPFNILEIINNIKESPIKTYKLLPKPNNRIQIHKYKALYELHPNIKVNFIGIADKFINLYPNQKLDREEYYMVRTSQGGLVMKGTEMKGVYENKKHSISYENLQIFQKIVFSAQEVYRGIYEVHIALTSLFTYPLKNRIQLVTGGNGKTLITHYYSKGYQPISTSLVNNQWWIFQYNPKTTLSMASKYQLFINSTDPKQKMYLKRVYGDVRDQKDPNELSKIIQQFQSQRGTGYRLLNVLKCIDEYYYFQFCSADWEHYGIARIHYKRISNRRPRIDGKYMNQFEKDMVIQELKDDILTKDIEHQTYAVVLQNQQMEFENWSQLNKYLQYQAYPYRIYRRSSKDQEIVYMINLRNIVTNGLILQNSRMKIKPSLPFVTLLPVYAIIFLILMFVIPARTTTKSSTNNQPIKKKKKQKNN